MQKIATADENLKSAGDKVSSTGEKLLPASAAVTALGVAAVKTDSDFDSSMSQVAAVSGATGDDFDKLRAKAHEMGAKTKFSASEAADAMNYMAMAGWKTSDILGISQISLQRQALTQIQRQWMIDDCETENIDMIITKSISRFARNTLDCLKYIPQLKDKNIPVFFEKEAINTMDAKGEVLITIMASLAQQES